jgi:two-component system NarL family response regulator
MSTQRPGGDDAPPVVRVVLADDHARIRTRVRDALEAGGCTVLAEASTAEEAVAAAEAHRPDVVLLDIHMPGNGIQAAREITTRMPELPVVMLTQSAEEDDLFDSLRAGAVGYLLKDIPIDEVATAVRAVRGGQSYISPSMASKLLTEFATMVRRSDERQQLPAPKLTDREMEVLKLVAKGLNNRDIAKQLFISENTVKNHIRNILEKLQLHSRMEAVVYAVREKLLEIT